MSACHSGERALTLPGLSELPGDDIFGLQAVMFQTGVRAVVGALWRLDDESAPELMHGLHQALARGRRSKRPCGAPSATTWKGPMCRARPISGHPCS